MISHKEFNVSKEIEFSNKNMFPYVNSLCESMSIFHISTFYSMPLKFSDV